MNNSDNRLRLRLIFFVFASLAAFFITAILVVWLKMPAFPLGKSKTDTETADRFYFNRDFTTDPLVTKNPSLKNILDGPIITSNDPSLGDTKAPVTIVEFADFECGYCRKLENIVKRVLENHQGEARLIWKDYPNSNANSDSYRAALAARCADEQNSFWPYHDLLFEQETLDGNVLTSVAEKLNLDMDAFDSCLSESRTKQKIEDNIDEANALDIGGVPFVYVNDQEIMGEISQDDLEKIVALELSKSKK